MAVCVKSVDRWSCPKSIFHIFPFPITEGISHLLPSCCNSLSEYFLATSVHDPLIKKYTRTSVCTVRDKICTPVWIVRRNGCANMCPACTLGLMMCPSSSKVNGNDSVAANVNVVVFLHVYRACGRCCHLALKPRPSVRWISSQESMVQLMSTTRHRTCP